MKALLAASLIVGSLWNSCAKGADWDTTDKLLFGTQVALQVVDVLQTNYARQHPEKFEEANPLYGNPPNMLKVVAVKSILVGGLYWVVKDMRSIDRKVVLGIADIVQLSVVNHNYQLGVKLAW